MNTNTNDVYNILCKKIVSNYEEQDVITIIRHCNNNKLYNLGKLLCKFFEKDFEWSLEIKEEYASICYNLKEYTQAHNIYNKLLCLTNIDEKKAKEILHKKHYVIPHVENNYNYYNIEKIQNIKNQKKSLIPKITLTMTTCKRLELFKQTMNTFLNCCEDIHLIDNWICIDDNSSEEDRKEMLKLYPFITFYMKNLSIKGHPQSMNIIRNIVNTPYIFHLEDDWKFIKKDKYITKCLEVLGENEKIGQCLLNKNYGEINTDINVKGGDYKITKTGLRYYIHEYVKTEQDLIKWIQKHSYEGLNSNYWPHFSLRPSLIRKKILNELGEFNEKVSHFELKYSELYVNKGYVSAFLEDINCLHIGRLTSEKHDPTKLNAYILNDEAQFFGKEEKTNNLPNNLPNNLTNMNIETYVINLERRKDRWNLFEENCEKELKFLNYNRFNAIDGDKLITNTQLQRIFDGNDYNMRRGMVGCALSHFKLYTNLINSKTNVNTYIIFEDDIKVVKNFEKKLLHLFDKLNEFDWDIVFLGHHMKKEYITTETYNEEILPNLEKWNSTQSLERSYGGTGGYIITKQGAIKLLDYINKVTMTNCIDTMIQKSSDELNVFYCSPHLIYTDCIQYNNLIDTDIQYNYNSLSLNLNDRVREEIEYLKFLPQIIDYDKILNYVMKQNQTIPVYYKGNPTEIKEIIKKCIYPYYTLEDKVIIIIPNIKDNLIRYFHRFKILDKYSIEDSLVYI